MNGSGLQNQLESVARVTDVFIAFLEGKSPRIGDTDTGSGSPNRSYCIADLPNGGCTIVNQPDEDDDSRESRRYQ